MNQNGDLRAAAQALAEKNVTEEPELRRVYWFPSENEVRLIEVYPYAIPVRRGESVAALRIGAYGKGGFPYAVAIGLVSPDDEGDAPLPAAWGDWSDAEVLWESQSREDDEKETESRRQDERDSEIMPTHPITNVQEAAEFLAKDHLITEPNLKKIYWFPAEDEVRLIDVYADAIPLHPGDAAAAFHFKPYPEGGIPFRYALALIRPEEDQQVPLPYDWGQWSDGVVLWEAK